MKVIPKVSRRALIIHNAGDELNELPGVLKDMENIQAFLRSNCGGAWEDCEVTVAPDDCSRNWLIDYFQKGGCTDYYLIFFVGHGCFDIHQGAIYGLPNGENAPRTWLRRLTKDVPTLLVTDSCLWIPPLLLEHGGTLGYRTFAEDSDANRMAYRMAYDSVLRELPYGMFVHASSVSPGEEAEENSEKGGFYMFSLLETAKGIVANRWNKNGVYGIASVHSRASRQVKMLSKGKQTPTLEGYTRTHQPPFVVKI